MIVRKALRKHACAAVLSSNGIATLSIAPNKTKWNSD